jgi:hypothetical protein
VTKELNESTARELIKDRMSKVPYRIPVEDITRLLARTLVDFKTVNLASGPGATLKRLLEKGYVLQTADIVSYPKISGTFMTDDCQVLVGDRPTPCRKGWHLEMVPNSFSVTGEYLFLPPASYPFGSKRIGARGTVQPDGKVELHVEEGGYGTPSYTYAEEGSAAYLVATPPSFETVGTRYKGSATGKRVDVKWYTYSWSPDFQKQLVGTGDATYVVGGGYEQVGDVSDLRLVTDTQATAKFSFRVSLNDLGKLFIPSQPPNGTVQATFGKKPDGTWFVDRP